MLKMKFGSSDYVTNSGSVTMPFSIDARNIDHFPLPSAQAGSKRGKHHCSRSITIAPRSSTILDLHPHAELPLESDLEIGIAPSVKEADLAAVHHNSPTVKPYAQMVRSAQLEPLVMLRVSRDPVEYHAQLRLARRWIRIRSP